MKKKRYVLIGIMLLCFILSSCQQNTISKDSLSSNVQEQETLQPQQSVEAEPQTQETELPETELPKTEEPEVPKKVNSVVVDFDRVEETEEDDKGNVLARMYYSKPIVEGESEAASKINHFYKEESEAFFYGSDTSKRFKENQYKTFFDYVKDTREAEGDKALIKQPFTNTLDSEVTYNNNGILSIKGSTDWMAGGVGQRFYYGTTFDLNTGERLYINDLVDKDDADIRKEILNLLENEMRENNPSYEYEYKQMRKEYKNKSMKDYEFYLDGSKIYLIFNEYVYSLDGYIVEAPFQANLSKWEQ